MRSSARNGSWSSSESVSVCTQRDRTGHAPIAGIVPEARRMPLYRVSHAPVRALQERGHVTGTPHMADVLRPEEATASMRRGDTMQRSRRTLIQAAGDFP
jgi:hypothetical protein